MTLSICKTTWIMNDDEKHIIIMIITASLYMGN